MRVSVDSKRPISVWDSSKSEKRRQMRIKVVTRMLLLATIRQLPDIFEKWFVKFLKNGLCSQPVMAITWTWSSMEDTTPSCIPPWEHSKSLAEALKGLKDVAKLSRERETPVKKMRIQMHFVQTNHNISFDWTTYIFIQRHGSKNI